MRHHGRPEPPATPKARAEGSGWRLLAGALVVAGVVAAALAAKLLRYGREDSVPGSDQATPLSPYLPTLENKSPAPGPSPKGMVWIPGGEFSMGSIDPRGCICGGPDAMHDAQPVHRVHVDGFWMDATEVTNEQFEEYVKATGYVTIGEQAPRAEDFPGAPPENLVAGSTVFIPTPGPVPLNDHFQWWRYQKGASWRHPEGPESGIKGREKYPVVHVAYDDAAAYAKWAEKLLPTEAEWEFAARGGMTGKLYGWGDDLKLRSTDPLWPFSRRSKFLARAWAASIAA